MVQAARCPKCGTSFRIVPDQLKISEGWVRCGNCAFVFNAYETQYEIHEEDLEQLLQNQGAGAAPDTLLPDPVTDIPQASRFQATQSSIFSPSNLQSSIDHKPSGSTTHSPLDTAAPTSGNPISPAANATTSSSNFDDSLLSELHISWADTQVEIEKTAADISSMASKLSGWMQSVHQSEFSADSPSKKHITFPDSMSWEDPDGDEWSGSSGLPPQARLPGLSAPSQKDVEEINFSDSLTSFPSINPSSFKPSEQEQNNSAFGQSLSANSRFPSSQPSSNASGFSASRIDAPSSKDSTYFKQNSTFTNTALKPLAPSFSSASNKSIFAETKTTTPADPDDFSFTNLADNDDDDLTQDLPEFSDSIPLILAVSDGFDPQTAKDTLPPDSIDLEKALYPSPPKKKPASKRPSVFEKNPTFPASQLPKPEKTPTPKHPSGTAHATGQKSRPSASPARMSSYSEDRAAAPSSQYDEHSPVSQIPASRTGPIYIDTNFASTADTLSPQKHSSRSDTRSCPSAYHSTYNSRRESRLKETADPHLDDISFIRQVDQHSFWNKPIFTLVNAFFCFAFALALITQSVFIFRDQIALKYPSLKPTLTVLCASLNCTIGYPKDTSVITIYDSKFQDTGDGNRYQFYLFMRNQGSQAVATPSIELTLKDNFEQIITRKIFTPEELNIAQRALQPGEELLIDKDLLINANDIRGFNVALFYP